MILKTAILFILRALAGIPLATWKTTTTAITSAETSLSNGKSREAWVRGVIDAVLPKAAPWAKSLLYYIALAYAAKSGAIHLSTAVAAVAAAASNSAACHE